MLKLRRRIDHPALSLPAGVTHSENDWERLIGLKMVEFYKDYWFEPPMVQVSRTNISNQYVVTVQNEKNIINFSNAFEAALSDVVAEMNSALNNCPEE